MQATGSCDGRSASPAPSEGDWCFAMVRSNRMARAKTPKAKFKAGDWVSFRYGIRDVVARILEPRGPIGVRQIHRYRIEIPNDDGDPDSFELPEEELHPAAPPVRFAVIPNGKKSTIGSQYPPGEIALTILVDDLIRKHKRDHPEEAEDLASDPPSWFSSSGDVFLMIGRSIYRIRNNKVEEELRKAELPTNGDRL